ncbi:MAG: hypothetical protein AB2807_08340, partial [Candidatus Sedimenticola endophacoides]
MRLFQTGRGKSKSAAREGGGWFDAGPGGSAFGADGRASLDQAGPGALLSAQGEGRVERVQECRYLVKDFGTSQSPKSTRQRDSRYCPD